MAHGRSRAVVVLVALAALVVGCAPTAGGQPTAAPTPKPVDGAPTDGGATTGEANVESIEVLILESFPVQVQVVARGNHPDGCTELDEPTVTRTAGEGDAAGHFGVTLPTTRPVAAACTTALEPFEVSIPLDVLNLLAGSYTVNVNGVTASFELAIDNAPLQGPEGRSNPCEQQRTEGQAVLTNEAAGYCIRYPDTFTVAEPEPDVVVIHGPDYSGGGPEPLSGFVNISVAEPAGGRTVQEVADDVVAAAQAPQDATAGQMDGFLGGLPAVDIIGVPGQRLDWHVVAVQGDRVVHLVFSPLGDEYGEANADRLALYESVMTSFTFLAAAGGDTL